MSTHPRRVHLIVLAARLADARTLVGQEFRAAAQAVRADGDLFHARLAQVATPAVLAAHGLSGVLTEAQWQSLMDIRSRVPAGWRASFFAAQGDTSTNPANADFWTWAATHGFVRLQEGT